MAADSAVRIIFLGDSASAVRSVSRLESSFGGLGRTAKLVTGAVGIAFIGALAGATKAAIDFDKSMRNVNSIAKLSEGQFKSLEKQVLSLGKTTGQTPKVLADGLYDIVSSGFKANDAIKILGVSAKAATAGMTDTATASKAVVAILNAYHLSADKAKNVSSLLFTEVNKGVNTFEELATNIGDTAPLAAQLKVPFSDVAAGLALITLHGTSMAEASTQMSRVMTDLLKPSDSLKKTLHDLGYENGQAAIQAHGFIPLIGQLSTAAGGSAAKTADWFQNIRSLRGILNLTGPNLKKFNEFADEMAASFEKGGADVAAFNEQSKSISVQWAKAKSALIAAAIPIGQLLFPALSGAAGAAQSLAEFITKVHDAPDLSAKFKTISAGAVGMARDITTALTHSLLGWSETISAGPTGFLTVFHNGLLQQIQSFDWADIGAQIAAGIAVGLKKGGELAKGLTDSILTAFSQVDWGAVAQKAGPYIVIALASAITTALDPAFWVKHWDIALSLALVIFGRGMGKLAARFGLLLLRPFIGLAPRFAALISTGLLAVAERLPSALQRPFLAAALAAGRALGTIVGEAGRVMGRVIATIAGRAGRINGLLRFSLKVLGVDAAIHAIAAFASFVAGKVTAAFNAVVGAIKNVGPAIAEGFIPGPILAVVGAVQTVIGWIETLIGWIKKIPDINIHVHVPGAGAIKHAIGGGIPFVPGHAEGGFVAGQGGSPQLIMAHAGEVILNPMQQAALGGAGFFKEMFGFSGEGPSFAAGGIVSRGFKPKRSKSGTSPHHKRRPRVRTTNKLARRALTAVDAVNQQEDDTDRAYGQLVRFFDISQETYIRTGPDGNDYVSQPDVDQRVSEIDQLIAARDKILTLLDEEKEKLKAAIEALKRAIANLVAHIKAENKLAAQEGEAITRLSKQIAAERLKKKDKKGKGGPNQGLISRWEAQIQTHKTYQGRHKDTARNLMSQVGDFQSAIKDENLNLLHTIPFDRRDVELDVLTLQGERKDIVGTTLPPSGGGGGGGGGAGTPTDDLIRLIGQLQLALGIQTAQQGIIGSFAKGTLSVPQTGLAMVHAGETITPAAYARGGGSDGGSIGDVIVHVTVEDGAVDKSKIRAEVVKATDQLMLSMGRSASERERSGRF